MPSPPGASRPRRAWLYEAERTGDLATEPSLAATAAVAYGLLDDAGRAERCSDVASRAALAPGADADPRRAAPPRRGRCSREGGHRAMLADAALAVERLPATAPDAPLARLLLGVAELAAGDAAAADRSLADAVGGRLRRARRRVARRAPRSCSGPASPMRAVSAISPKASRAGPVPSCVTPTWRARAPRPSSTRWRPVSRSTTARRPRRGPTSQPPSACAAILGHALPWAALRARLDMAAALLALADVAGARLQLREIREIGWLRPDLGAIDAEVATVAAQVDAIRETNLSAFMLTVAELRLLPLLATHLTFPEIGERLFLSTNTIKTEAKSIYRKLNVASRSAAVERAGEIGLLEPWIRLAPVTAPDGPLLREDVAPAAKEPEPVAF